MGAPEPVKRKAEEVAAKKTKTEEAPAKKAKTEEAPAKKVKADVSPDDVYVKALVDYLKKNGKTSIANLGSKVPRPKDLPKMKLKAVFEKHPDKFLVAGDSVAAK